MELASLAPSRRVARLALPTANCLNIATSAWRRMAPERIIAGTEFRFW
jgi:hypothetical protein